jgi:hypothetical protein
MLHDNMYVYRDCEQGKGFKGKNRLVLNNYCSATNFQANFQTKNNFFSF